MPRRTISDGASYTFVGVRTEVPAPTEGDPNATRTEYAPLGADANALFPGQAVTVREIVPADQPGAHDDSEDAVVVEWEVPDRVRTEDGWGMGTAQRAMSIGLSQFHDLFEEA